MRNFLSVTGTVGLVLLLLWWLAPSPPTPKQMDNLPWQIEVFDDGSSKVFGLHLGQDSLEQAIDMFGTPEGLSLFSPGPEPKDFSLEAYFSSLQNGPLSARLVLTLEADQASLRAMADRVTDRKPGTSGAWQWQLGRQDQETATRLAIKAMTYIPHYGQLDEDFFRLRFGEPTRRVQIDANRQRWLYPDKGLSILIDRKGKEVLQYQMPRDFSAWEARSFEKQAP